MYYMIHATDHPEVPKLMERASKKPMQPKEPLSHSKFSWDLQKLIALNVCLQATTRLSSCLVNTSLNLIQFKP